ncbi:MAG: DUF4214 domain-containing protein, partial [Rhizobiaceae bacterium]
QALGAGATLTDTIAVSSVDGTSHDISITITGINDAAIIAGDDQGSVTEDATSPVLTDSGTLTVADTDAGQAGFVAGTVAGTYGSISISATGNWTYSADNSQSVIQALAAGATLTDTITVSSVDGTSLDISTTITGVNGLLVGGSGNDLLQGEQFNARDHYDAQTFRIYQAALDRTPDGDGLEYWSSRLLDGTETILTVANGFVTSTEFVTTYGSLDDTQFVNLLYNNVLDREADAGGLAAWLNALATGLTRAEVVVGFSESKEFIGNTQEANAAFLSSGIPTVLTDDVYRLYQATLDREPDAAGLLGWLTALGGGATKQQVADGFVSSTEFQSVYGALDDAQFVTLLYNNVLGRDPDAGGFANWLDEINAGAARAEVVLGFSDSAEFIESTQAGANAWVQSADLGNDVLFGGAGDDRLFGGLGADTFVFDASLDGTDFVGDLESWDTLVFNDFNYSTTEDALAHFTQVGGDAVFADQGNTITFYNTNFADLDHADMFRFDDTSLLS